MYADVAFKLSPAQRDLSFFRSKPYFQQLERAMEDLEKWTDQHPKVGPKKGFVDQGPKKGFADSRLAAEEFKKALAKKTAGFG